MSKEPNLRFKGGPLIALSSGPLTAMPNASQTMDLVTFIEETNGKLHPICSEMLLLKMKS